jgi:hypothetical protein
VNDAQDVALGRTGVRPEDKVRRRQRVEVRDMAVDKSGRVIEFPQFFRRRGRVDLVYGIYGLTRGQMMDSRSNAADARHHARDFFHGHALDELLEPAEFGDLKVGVGHAAFVVEEDLDLPVSFQARDGIYGNPLHRVFLLKSDAPIANRLKERNGSGI